MSLDDQVVLDTGGDDTSYKNTPPPKKSGSLKWIFGGCGCLGLMAAICFGVIGWFSFSVYGSVRQEAKSFVESSTVVQRELGSPITINSETFSQGADGAWVFDFGVSGPQGSGVATVNMENDGKSFDFTLGDSSLDFNGETIDLDAEAEFGEPVIEGLDF